LKQKRNLPFGEPFSEGQTGSHLQTHIKYGGNWKRLFREQHRIVKAPCRPQDNHTRVLKRGFEVERDKGIVLNHEDQQRA
jgi:hypothetical protein